MTKGSGGFGNRLSRCVRAPFRALSRARDFYVRSMTDCAGRMHYGTAAAPLSFLPLETCQSSSSNGRLSSSDEDLIELIRASSKSRLRAAAAAEGSVQRSQSVAAVRIDEDAPYESSGEVKIGGSLIFPRSRSCAVGGTTTRSAITWKYK
ncbi:hypothetical protein HPP92_019121 [Vanilla planifolia]|uniref:Uncharacterized protein n=1 Tax=Vanilla planifolia TaxID=51239 RepID=A0A835Q8Y0_VANPL|nr:hypothetical protein HPP92_019121 [Vanilla planifolia]